MLRTSLIVSLCLALFACDSGSDTDLETAFCNLLAGGATVTVDAANEPEVAREDKRVVIALEMSNDGYVGRVKFTADERGSFAFGLDTDVPFVVMDSDGAIVQHEQRVDGAEACSELVVRYTVPMQRQAYWLELGPTDVSEIAIVSEESDDDL